MPAPRRPARGALLGAVVLATLLAGRAAAQPSRAWRLGLTEIRLSGENLHLVREMFGLRLSS